MNNDRELLDKLCLRMTEYFSGDPKRIQHFIKVHSFAALIGRGEMLDSETLTTLEAAAYVHDIGIKRAELIYNSSSGKYQEELGPEDAEKMLKECGFTPDRIERVKYLVGHHHTYNNIVDADYRILVEADFLVNLYEDDCSTSAAKQAYNTIFKTNTGKELCKRVFAL
jgi:HD superfamily phosphodiesterase